MFYLDMLPVPLWLSLHMMTEIRDAIEKGEYSICDPSPYFLQESIFEKNSDIVRGCNAFDLCDAVRLLTK